MVKAIGNGRDSHLWMDYWLPEGKRPCDLLSLRQLTGTGHPWNAKVSDIIEGNIWNFPLSPDEDVQRMWNLVSFQPQVEQQDSWVWTKHASGKCTIKSA